MYCNICEKEVNATVTTGELFCPECCTTFDSFTGDIIEEEKGE